ncbi:MAG: AmmeMemoRadiSam system protein B [Chloroflexi bacterium]|nr:AmmeMemoRadiSam system protein B [Chloroflexota bacterium]
MTGGDGVPGTVTGPMVGRVRSAAVAGSFYPPSPGALAALVQDLMADAARLVRPDAAARTPSAPIPAGLLVPHAGLDYSGVVAAAGWSALASPTPVADGITSPLTVVILGTNHRAGWLDGIGIWDAGAWRTPLGDVLVNDRLARDAVDLGAPFVIDRDAHAAEHAIEVQLPLLQAVRPDATIVPLAVSAGTGIAAIDAGRRLGELLARLRSAGSGITLAVSTDMAHYPSAAASAEVTEALLHPIVALDPAALAAGEAAIRAARIPGLVCGMCGVEPSIVGLAALRAMGAVSATRLATATSADRGGPTDRTVGYLAVRFDA